MNDESTHERIAALSRRRDTLDCERRLVEKAYVLAVLDHVAAYVRTACPQAVYVTFAYYGSTRTLDLHGVLGAQTSPLGSCPWLWDGSEEGHPLTEHSEELELDVQVALKPYDSPVWSAVKRNRAMDGNSWLLELPPPDRAARIAELVREHHPEAIGIIVDGRAAGGRVIEVIEAVSEDGSDKRTTQRLWPRECDDAITRLVAQIFALPDLADRHLTPVHGLYQHPHGISMSRMVRLMPLPPTV